jgi:hypothetical protein
MVVQSEAIWLLSGLEVGICLGIILQWDDTNRFYYYII